MSFILLDQYGKAGNMMKTFSLNKAVLNAFVRASDLKQTSISIPAISSGIFGYPLERAWKMIALGTKQYLDSKEEYKNTLKTIVMWNINKNVIIFVIHI